MHAFLRPILLIGSVAVVAGLALANTSAHAQSPIATYSGYYYSPGGYSGGLYFRPGYYPLARPSVTIPALASSPRPVPTVPRRPKYIEDWSTGRTNYPLPLTKPWMRPLQ